MLCKNNTNTTNLSKLEIAACNCPDCDDISGSDCENSVEFKTQIFIPSIFNITTPVTPDDIHISWNDNCLNCITDCCNLPGTTINPCNEEEVLDCNVTVKRFKYIGSIKFIACLNNITGENESSSCLSSGVNSLCVNQVICYTCNCEASCPILDNLVKSYVITDISVDTDTQNNTTVFITGNFNFIEPPCNEA